MTGTKSLEGLQPVAPAFPGAWLRDRHRRRIGDLAIEIEASPSAPAITATSGCSMIATVAARTPTHALIWDGSAVLAIALAKLSHSGSGDGHRPVAVKVAANAKLNEVAAFTKPVRHRASTILSSPPAHPSI